MFLNQAVSDAWSDIRRSVLTTVAGVLTVAISLVLLGSALLLRDEVRLMREYLYTQVEVAVFLRDDVTQEQRDALRAQLEGTPEVRQVVYETKAEAFRRFKLQFKESPELINNVTEDALPESFRIELVNPEQYAVIASTIQGKPGVDNVVDQGETLDRIFSVLDGLSRAVVSIAAIVLVAATLLIGNAMRVAAYYRRREIGIMRLVGANRLRIQSPFIVEAAIIGTVGSALAFGILATGKATLLDKSLAGLFAAGLLPTITWTRLVEQFPTLLAVGVGITAVTSLIATRRYTRV